MSEILPELEEVHPPEKQEETEPTISVGDEFKSEVITPPEKSYTQTSEEKHPESLKKGFSINFDPSDLQTYGQASRVFTLPGTKSLHKVYMGTLWEIEEEEIALSISSQVNPLDMITRNILKTREVLVKSIYKINDKEFTDVKNAENERILKHELRDLIYKLSETSIELWYFCYKKLCDYRDALVAVEVSSLKKALELEPQQL